MNWLGLWFRNEMDSGDNRRQGIPALLMDLVITSMILIDCETLLLSLPPNVLKSIHIFFQKVCFRCLKLQIRFKI